MVHISGAAMPAAVKDGVFLLQQAYMSGTRFRVEVTTKQECYVYAFASDSTYLKMYQVFPNKKSNNSPHFDGQSTFPIPGPTENYFSKLDNTIGVDYYCILFSRRELDLASVLYSLENLKGDFHSRVRGVLKNDLTDEDKIVLNDNNEMMVASTDHNHSILPLVVELRHIESTSATRVADRIAPMIVLVEPSVNFYKKDADGTEETTPVTTETLIVKGYAQDESEIRMIQVDGKTVPHKADGYFETNLELNKLRSQAITVRAEDRVGNTATRTFKVFRKK
jgi:hypothetical protein